MSPDKYNLFHKYPYDACPERGTGEQAFLACWENTQTLLMGEKCELQTGFSPSQHNYQSTTLKSNENQLSQLKKIT